MKKRILSILAALCLALALLPSTAWGAENVAKVGDIEYATLDATIAAVNAGGAGPIYLIGDVVLTQDTTLPCGLMIPNDTTVIVDLGGKTLRGAADTYAIRATNKSSLTVKNGTIQLGVIDDDDNWAWGVDNRGGTVEVSNVIFNGTGDDPLGDAVTANWDWDFTTGNDEGGYSLAGNGQYGATIVNNCTVNGDLYVAAYNNVSNTVTIKGGNYRNFLNDGGSIRVESGTIKQFDFSEFTYENDGRDVVFKISDVAGVTVPTSFKGKIIFEDAEVKVGSSYVNQFLGGTYEGNIDKISTFSGKNLQEQFVFGSGVSLTDTLVNSINTAISKSTIPGNFLQKDATSGNWTFSEVDTVSITAKAGDTPEISSISFNDTTSATPKTGIQKTLIKKAKVTLSYTGLTDSHYEFKGWYAGNERKSTDNPYTFSAGETATYVATFGLLPSIQAAKDGAESWYNTHASGDIVSIGTIQEMNYFAMAVANGKDFAGKTVKLTADLNYSGKEFFVIGDATHPFKGVFDGGNHTIRNISADKIIRPLSNDPYTALFAKLNRATVQNLKLQDSDFSQSTGYQNYSGGIAADATDSTVKNCTLSNVSTDAWFNSPVVAHAGGGITLENITATNCTPGSGKGGTLLGYSDGATIKNVVVDGVKSYDGTNSGAALIGHANSGSNTVENATVNAPNASLIGSNYVQDSAGTVTITGNNTSITAKNVADTAAPAKSIAIENGNLSVSQPTTISGGTLSLGKAAEITVANGNTFATLNAGSKIVTDDGSTEITVASSGEGAVDKHGNLSLPAGSTISTGNESSSVTVSNSAVVTPNGTVVEGTSSAAPTINSNGSVTVPSGGTVTKADGTSQTLQNGGSVTSGSNDGDVVTPNNSHHNAKLPTPTGKIESPATADPGIAIYAALALSSLMGLGYANKKR